MKNILVTGGFGFIGSHLVDRLLEQGHRVFVVDDLRSNAVEPDQYAKAMDSLQLVWDHSRVEDVLMHFGKMDEIYHLASPVGPVGVLQYAGDMVRQITESTYAVIELAKRHNAKLVDVSTSEVYGGGQQGLCAEDMPRIIQAETTVRLEYAVAKLAMETALINTTKVSDLQAVIVRPFNVAGPRQGSKGGFVMARFVEQALRHERLTIYGDGSQIRAFTHVADIVDGLLLAMEKGKSGEVYNLGNPNNKTTIEHLAWIVQMQVAIVVADYVNPKTIHGPLFAEAADKHPDAWKAIRELDWLPQYSLEQIVRDVRDYMQSTFAEGYRRMNEDLILCGRIIEGKERAEMITDLHPEFQKVVAEKGLVPIVFYMFGSDRAPNLRFKGSLLVAYNIGMAAAYARARLQGELISWERLEDWETVKT